VPIGYGRAVRAAIAALVLLTALPVSAKKLFKKAEAQQHLEAGTEAYQAKDFDKAITEFEASYALVPDAQVLYNLAQANRLGNHPEAALENYRKFLEASPDAPNKAAVEQRIAELQKQVENTQREALRRRVQAAHGISDEDADLFLTGKDEETVTAQAERLAARESERKTKGNRVPHEGQITKRAGEDPMREFTRNLFGRED